MSAGFLKSLGAEPILGRDFVSQEDAPGGQPIAMISEELWRSRFAADSQIVGKTLNLGATPFTVVGVLPPHFQFPVPDVDVWMTAPTEWPQVAPKSGALSPFLTLFGRVKSGVSLEQANTELQVIQGQYAMAYSAMLDARPKTPVQVVPMKECLWRMFGPCSGCCLAL